MASVGAPLRGGYVQSPTTINSLPTPTYRVGQNMQYYSDNKKAWFEAVITKVESDGVEIDLKPGYKLKGRELEARLQERNVQGSTSTSTSNNLPPPVGYPQVTSPTVRPLGTPPQVVSPQLQSVIGRPPQVVTPTVARQISPQSDGVCRVVTSAQLSSTSAPVKKPIAAVEYYSTSLGGWKPAIFEGFNKEFGTYTLDIKPFANPGDVRLAPGASAEYYSSSKGTWVVAEVVNFNEEMGVYTLDVQPYARPEAVRLQGFEECLMAPRDNESVGEARRQLSPQAVVPVDSLKPSDQIPVNAYVEYFSASKGAWVPATVIGFDEESGKYQLDIKSSALACNIRLPGKEFGEDSEVPQFNVQKYKTEGEVSGFAVFLESTEGTNILAFDQDIVNFELACEAEALQAWLDGMTLEMLPGLLTFLQSDAQVKHERLEGLRKEKETYRKQTDYSYFGLDEEKATDKDIDRAYRKAASKLHPDKGGDTAAFNEMQAMYEEIKSMRGEKDAPQVVKEAEGDPMAWDPSDRASMLRAHETMRNFLIWVSNDLTTVTTELEELRKRFGNAPKEKLADGMTEEPAA